MKNNVKIPVLLGVVVLVAAVSETRARDLRVGGAGEGHFPTLRAAINAAKPGDTIHLDPAGSPYREMAVFDNVSGKPGQPIVLDGHGATLLGCDPVDPAQWEDRGEGLWRSKALAERLRVNQNLLSRFFFVFDDEIQYMGGASKHQAPTLKPPADLEVAEWTYVESENAFYIRVAAGVPLEDAGVEAPVRSAGVAMRGQASNIVVRNVKASRAWNDGFNIHGQCSNLRFENIEAIECGDDGISAHGQCEIVVDGMISRGNANGICHVDESRSVARNIRIRGSRAYDLYLLHESRHELYDVTIEPNGPRGTVFTSGTQVGIERATIGSDGAANRLSVRNGARVAIADSQLRNALVTVQDATAELTRTAITGDRSALAVNKPRGWRMRDCTWEGRRLTHDGRRFEPDDLAGFQASVGASVAQDGSE